MNETLQQITKIENYIRYGEPDFYMNLKEDFSKLRNLVMLEASIEKVKK